MKRILVLACYFCFHSLLSNVNSVSSYYYFCLGKKVNLSLDSTKIVFTSSKNKLPLLKIQNIASVDTLYNGYLVHSILNVALDEFDKKYSQDYFVSYLFKTDESTTVSLTNQILVKLKPEELPKLQNLSKLLGFSISEYNQILDVYILTVYTYNPIQIFTIVRNLESNLLLDYVEPNFYHFGGLCTNDSLYSQQWYLKNTGQFSGTPNADINIEPAWGITLGDTNIRVAVLEAFSTLANFNHPDIKPMSPIDPNGFGWNAYGYSGESHGLPCIGIINAKANNVTGVAGICPNCKVVPIKLAVANSSGGWNATSAEIATAITSAYQNSDIINNSNFFGSTSSLVNNAIDNAFSIGRNGKGVLFFSSSGNSNTSYSNYPASYPTGISVGAMSMCNERKSNTSCDGESWWGGNYGTELDISAPGVKIMTTDIVGTSGYSATNYHLFNGTSSACPVTVGVAGLCLSANPNLTASQLRYVIESSCRKVGATAYTTTKPNGSWNNVLGHGMVNAYQAVRAADSLLPHPYDECSIAKNLISDTICNYTSATLRNAKPSNFPRTNCNGYTSNTALDVWFKFTAKSNLHKIIVRPEGGSGCVSCIAPIIELYSGCDSTKRLVCTDNTYRGDSLVKEAGGFNVGLTYYIRVYHYGDSIPPLKNFEICVSHGVKKTDLSISQNSFVQNFNSVNHNYTIKNIGNKPSGKFEVHYYLSNSPIGSTLDYLIAIDTIANLDSNQTQQISKNINSCEISLLDGRFYPVIIIDKNNEVVEVDELNNRLFKPDSFIVDCNIDLQIENTVVNIVAANQINVRTTIANKGNISSNQFNVLLYLSKNSNHSTVDYILFQDSFSLVQRSSRLIDRNFNLCDMHIPNGDYYLGIIVDSANAIAEKIEINNRYNASQKIALDCFIDLTYTNTSFVELNNSLTIDLSVHNIGVISSNSFKIGIYVSTNPMANPLANLLDTIYVNKLDANEQRQFSHYINLCNYNIVDSNYYLIIYIDKDSLIKENNKDNNVYRSEKFQKKCNSYITVKANPIAGGTVSGSGNYKVGNSASLRATPNVSYKFVNWTIDTSVLSNKTSYSYPIMKKDVTITAHFSKNSYISNNSQNAIVELYPNPTEGTIYIGSTKIVEISIYSMDGKLLRKGLYENKIDISDLESGIYNFSIDGQFFKISKY